MWIFGRLYLAWSLSQSDSGDRWQLHISKFITIPPVECVEVCNPSSNFWETSVWRTLLIDLQVSLFYKCWLLFFFLFSMHLGSRWNCARNLCSVSTTFCNSETHSLWKNSTTEASSKVSWSLKPPPCFYRFQCGPTAYSDTFKLLVLFDQQF